MDKNSTETGTPIVSIIVPVYNVEKYICQCLDSIVAQTFTDFEAVLVDDGSTDSSGDICDEYAQKDPHFTAVHKQNEGVAKARITAFEHSKGEYITFIDADDYVSPRYLEILSKPIIEEGAEMVSCDYYDVFDGMVYEPTAKRTGVYNKEQIKDFVAKHYFYDKQNKSYGMTCFLWSKMVSRKLVLDALRQGEGMWYAEDQIGVFHILQHCNKLVLIPDRLYYYVHHEGQAMKKYDMSLWDNLVILMEKYESLDKEGLYKEGRRKRTWRHIDNTIFNKMMKADISKETFCSHLGKVRSTPVIKDFFSPLSIDFDLKENIKYWLLKLKLFQLFYFLCRKNREEK